ncbi:MAG: hypothetical protein ACRD0P_10635 [Stackebrandtia sp.]
MTETPHHNAEAATETTVDPVQSGTVDSGLAAADAPASATETAAAPSPITGSTATTDTAAPSGLVTGDAATSDSAAAPSPVAGGTARSDHEASGSDDAADSPPSPAASAVDTDTAVATDEADSGSAGFGRSDADEAPAPQEVADEEDQYRPSQSGELQVPDDVDYYDLDRETRAGLRSLPKGLAENVGRRLVAAGRLIDVDPNEALEHAFVARKLASRIAVVREATGVAAYHAGEWQTAISELRTAQRLTGTRSHVAVIADAERALGRPERAIDAYRELGDAEIETDVRIELLIVAAGARRDMGHGAAGLAMLQVPELNGAGGEPWRQRLRYAYADALAHEGRTDDARRWFTKVLENDEDDVLDVAERLLELDGVAWLAEPEDGDGEPAGGEA